jgi:hypothetical protein
MSSRSLAAARAKRAGETAPPVSGTRPGTSIGSHAAFSQPMPSGYQQQQQSNVRIGKAAPANQPARQPPQQTRTDNAPFTKLSISDAIGLITLRLGKIESWVYETEHQNMLAENGETANPSTIPDNSRIIDVSVLTSIINRLDSLETSTSTETNDELTKLVSEVTKMNEQLTRVSEEGTKHNLAIMKHAEQILKFDRDLVETKDILKTFMLKYDAFVNETNDRFSDFELALAEVEKNVQPVSDTANEDRDGQQNAEGETEDDGSHENESADLKAIVKRELAEGGNSA